MYKFDLLKDGLTQSQIKNYIKCKRFLYFSLVRGWSEEKLSDSLVFGILFHNYCEFVYKNLDGPLELDHAVGVVCEAYLEENDADTWGLEQRQEWEIITAKLRAIAPAYWNWWLKEDARFQWVEVEQVFKVDVPVILRNGTKVVVPFTGKMDGLVRVLKALALFETKTKGRVNLGGITNTVLNDFQINSYLWALRTMGHKCTRFIYNIVHNPSLRLGSKETIDQYEKRIVADISKNPADYFIRLEKQLSDKQLDVFGGYLVGLITEIANFILLDKAESEDRFTPECLGPYGQCELMGICYHGDSKGLKRRDYVHPELHIPI